MTVAYLVVVGVLEAPAGCNWVDVPDVSPSILRCRSNAAAEEAAVQMRAAGLYAEVFRTFATANIDLQFRQIAGGDKVDGSRDV